MKCTYEEMRETFFKLSYNKRDAYYDEWYKSMEVGDRANVRLYSDVEPCTIIKKTATTLTVRYDKATLDPNWKPEVVLGGFAGHCVNNEDQKWIIEEDPNGRVEIFRFHKNEGRYMSHSCKLYPEWRKFYDYNF